MKYVIHAKIKGDIRQELGWISGPSTILYLEERFATKYNKPQLIQRLGNLLREHPEAEIRIEPRKE